VGSQYFMVSRQCALFISYGTTKNSNCRNALIYLQEVNNICSFAKSNILKPYSLVLADSNYGA
jgi:hypothetical protein